MTDYKRINALTRYHGYAPGHYYITGIWPTIIKPKNIHINEFNETWWEKKKSFYREYFLYILVLKQFVAFFCESRFKNKDYC